MHGSINLAAKANGGFRANYKAGLTVCNWPSAGIATAQVNGRCRQQRSQTHWYSRRGCEFGGAACSLELGAGEDALAKRYRAVLESWHVVELTADIAETAARLRARHKLKLPDAIQLASALAINAHALVTHDRDFAKVRGIRVVG